MIKILDVIKNYHIDIRKVGETYMALCPFHDDKNPSMAIYPHTNTFFCFSCKVTGDSIKFVQLIENCSRKDAEAILGLTNEISMDHLKERIQKLDNEVEDETWYNDEVNMLISKKFYKVLKENPNKINEIFEIMKEFDDILINNISYDDGKKIIEDISKKLNLEF